MFQLRPFVAATLALFSVAAIAEQNSTVPTIRTSSQLVMVDVIVLGKDGKPIHGLPKSAFSIKEDKKPQSILDFEEHQAGTPQNTLENRKLPPGVFSNFHPVSTDAPLNILLLDTLNTPLKDQMYVRQQIRDYVNHAPAGARIAVFGLAAHLYFLQGFTSDPEMLKRAIGGGKEVRQSPIVGTSDMANISSAGTGMLIQTQANDYADQFAKEEVASRNQVRTQYTLEALNTLARYLSGFPARKNLIWFAGNFPINLLPGQQDMNDPFTMYAEFGNEYRDTVNLMAKAQVAVYPVDARGVFGANLLTADKAGPASAGEAAGESMQSALSQFHESVGAEHAVMQQMADDTGGRVFMNTNNLSSAVKEAISDGSNFYTLTYSPTNKDNDGLFRAIAVNVEGGYKIRHRQGYYSSTKDEAARAAKDIERRPTLTEAAMMHGAPEPTEIYINVQMASTKKETSDLETDTLAAGNWSAAKLKPPYRTLNVTVAADPSGMSAQPLADGRRKMDLEVVSVVFTADGKPLTSVTNQLHGLIDPQTYAGLSKTGVTVTQQISVPVKGGDYIRTGVRDLNNGRMGAVEVPTVLTRNLTAQR